MKRGGPFRQALGDIFNRSPELLVVGLLADGVPTLLLTLNPVLRTSLFYVVWGGVTCVLAFLNNFQTRDELERQGKEPRAWKTIIALQVAYVVAVGLMLGPSGA